MCVGGGNPPGIQTESWNGTSWTEVADMAKARVNFGQAGAGTVAVIAMAAGPSPDAQTEEFTASAAVVTVTTS